MIKTAQRRFIAVTLTILFTVFTVIFFSMWIITRANFTREVQITLDDIVREYGAEYDGGEYPDAPRKPFRTVAVIEVSSSYGNNYKTVYGEDNIAEETLSSIAKTVAERQSDITDRVGDVYYKSRRLANKTAVYVADMSEDAARFRSALLKTLILLAVAFGALAGIVWVLSSKVFEPIKRILAKQKQFISDASHELKTPVAIISANADVVKTDDNAQYIDSIKKQVERLNFLVSDLLTLARLDEGNVKSISENFNLSDEITQTALPFDAVAFEKGKTLLCEIEPNIYYYGAKDDVKKILNILLDNAVKYAADGGKIAVSLKKTGGKCELTVANDGSLIREEDSQKIFERFYRGDLSRSRESGGNGLGLSIAKSIATANRWEITAKSVYGKSMTIILTL